MLQVTGCKDETVILRDLLVVGVGYCVLLLFLVWCPGMKQSLAWDETIILRVVGSGGCCVFRVGRWGGCMLLLFSLVWDLLWKYLHLGYVMRLSFFSASGHMLMAL